MKIIKLSAIDSTNTYLKEASKNIVLEDGIVVVTKIQTEGRGQMGAKWKSEEGLSLTFSMFKRFSQLLINEQYLISFAVSIGIKNALQKLQIPELSIKWPNDIMSYQKKLSGVLIENQLEGNKIASSVIGIGINVNETKFKDLPYASSMKLVSGISFNLDEVLQIVSEAIMNEVSSIEGSENSKLKEKYEADLFRKNKVSVFKNSEGVHFNGIIRGVSDNGKLLVEIEDESTMSYELKEIKMLF